MRDEGVRNDLLVSRISFGKRTRQEEIVPPRKKRAQILLWLEAESLKTSELIEQASPNNKNIFVRLRHRR